MTLPIYLYGQPVLRKQAEEITADYNDLATLIDNMFKTMYQSEGIGLAAPQIGLPIKLIVIDLDYISDDNSEFKGFKKVLINPTITYRSEESNGAEEGCLSLPGIHEKVMRPTHIKIQYQDEHFQLHEEEYSDFFARVVQHEYDHLEGKMFIDHLSPIRKQMIKGKLNNIVKGKAHCSYKSKAVNAKR